MNKQPEIALGMWQAYCDKKMEVERLHEVNQELLEALKAILPYVITQSIGCHGYKCREPWCWSCNGEEDAEEAVSKSWLAHDKVKAAIAKATGESE